MSDWLELELAHHLAPTKAPEQLWNRLQTPRPRPVHRPKWPVAAIITVMVAAGTLWMVAKGQEPPLNLHQLAIQQLKTQRLDIQSADVREISDWARREAGIDLNLAPSPRTEVRGASLLRQGGECIAAVSYRVDGREAALLVARASGSPGATHGGMSWRNGKQSYALAFSDSSHSEAACAICHSVI